MKNPLHILLDTVHRLRKGSPEPCDCAGNEAFLHETDFVPDPDQVVVKPKKTRTTKATKETKVK